jgi:hypothetical protein
MVQSGNSTSFTELSIPHGTGDYVVKEGECVSSIAFTHGHFWETIWNHPDNAEIKKARENPNVLLAGDRLTVPPIEQKYEEGVTEKRHRFRRWGEPARLRLRFLLDGDPRSGEHYLIDIDGLKLITGELDQDGCLDVGIYGGAKLAQVKIGEPDHQDIYELTLGGTDPETELSGLQQRLTNLGYGCYPEKVLGEGTRAALRAFQSDNGLLVTGEYDVDTRKALLSAHGS